MLGISLTGGIEDHQETLAVGGDIEFVQAAYLEIRRKQFPGSLGPNTLRPAATGIINTGKGLGG